MLCCLLLVFLVYQEICTAKYLQNETMVPGGGGVDFTIRK